MPTRVAPADQPSLFAEAASPRPDGGPRVYGPRGLLRALARQGLDPAAVEFAAALVLYWDREAMK
jgi:hypothetical protein